jgi:hypothetical protein
MPTLPAAEAALIAASVSFSAASSAKRAVEHGGRDGEVAVPGVAVGHRLDVAVQAEDLLDHHDAAARLAGRLGAPGGEFVPVGRGEFDHLAHG